MTLFEDRRDAGRQLAQRLARYRDRSDVVVLALPRGGVPVAYEVAGALRAPLDVLIVHRLSTPDKSGMGLGAVAYGGARVLNDSLIKELDIAPETVSALIAEAQRDITRRQRSYRGSRPDLDLEGAVVIVVDDGVATGATVRAAARALRRLGVGRLIVAVPTLNPAAMEGVRAIVDELVYLAAPEPYLRVGARYARFPAVDDDEVRRLLGRAARAYRDAARDTRAP